MNSINSYRKAASLSFPKSPSRLFLELPFSLQQGLGAGIHVPRAGPAPMTGSLLSDTSRSQCWEEKQFRVEVPTLTLKTCHTHTHTHTHLLTSHNPSVPTGKALLSHLLHLNRVCPEARPPTAPLTRPGWGEEGAGSQHTAEGESRRSLGPGYEANSQ